MGCAVGRRRPLTGRDRLTGKISTLFVIPGGDVVLHGGSIVAGEKSIFRQFESLFHYEGGVGVIEEVLVRDPLVSPSQCERPVRMS